MYTSNSFTFYPVYFHRIAAGEVVQRPSSALKELLENSIDAHASSITITCRKGGLEFLQIQDNGDGIRKEDFEIVCERFTTSKLTKIEDLNNIQTFGFRGEALASISHVAHLQITSMTRDSPCAYKGKYSDGRLLPESKNAPPQARPCAGNPGTIITVEDLFYNSPTRKEALKNHNEEYQRIIDVIQRYAIEYPTITFICRKQNQSTPDVYTSPASSTIDRIRQIYGNEIARELLPVDLKINITKNTNNNNNSTNNYNQIIETEFSIPESIEFITRGAVSNANYSGGQSSAKKSPFILFINGRLVENAALKKSIEMVYEDILPKHARPFVYLSIR